MTMTKAQEIRVTTVRYFVTGGAGFIGSHIAEALLDGGESVIVFDNLATGRETNLTALKGDVQFIAGDIRDFDLLRTAMKGVEVVFHQAALASVPRSIADPIASLEANINGTQNVLLAARDTGVRRVVFASSSSVYGNTPTLPKREDMPANPMSPYAVHKLTGELLCGVFTRLYGLETVALRYFNVFGPRQDPNSQYAAVIPRFLTALINKQRPIVFGDGEQTRDFTFIGNVVHANLLAATSPDACGHVINIGCGQQVSLNIVLQLAAKLLNVTPDPEYREPRPGDVHDSLADISLAQRLLHYKPVVEFRDGLAQTLEAMLRG
jgi:nucleoside-diphosphate-sugar epimerase